MIDKHKALMLARAPSTALLLLSLMGFSSCSSVPDEVNPVEWYRGASGWFESDSDQAQRDQANTAKETAPPLPGSNKDYPNLSTVPERPRSVTSPEERNRVQDGLAADRENARYAKPEAGRPSGTEVGAPIAAPRTPVTIGPSGPSPETLEALPSDITPPPAPTPRSSLDNPAPQPTAAAEAPTSSVAVSSQPESVDGPASVDTPTVQPASYQSAEPAAAGGGANAAILAAAGASDAPPSPAPRSTSPATVSAAPATSGALQPAVAAVAASAPVQDPSPAAPASNIVVAQANAPAAGASGSQDLPRSFMVYFTGGTASLDGVDKEVLGDVARLYKSHGGSLRIVGHASSTTREKDAYRNQVVNLRVSTQRAETVAGELARLGVPRNKMTVAGVSDSEPLYAETTQSGIAGNRRVEIFFGP